MTEEIIDPENFHFDDSFVASVQGEAWNETELEPWNPPRQIAAQSMGMLYPFIGDDGMEMLARTGVYPGALRDVIIFLWLRLQKPAAVLKAQRKPSEAWGLAERWSEEAGMIDLTGAAFRTGYELFSGKMAAMREVSGDPPKSNNSAPMGNAPCPPHGGPPTL